MTPAQEEAARKGGYTAGHMAALCEYLARALQADPDTALAGEAVEGLGHMARVLSDELLELCDPAGRLAS